MSGPGVVIRKQDVVDRFWAILNTMSIVPNRAGNWYYGYVPGAPGDGNIWYNGALGSPNETPISTAEISDPDGYLRAWYLFESLNNIARRFASVRYARWTYNVSGCSYTEGYGYAHVSAGYSMAGWIGVGHPVGAGNYIYWADVDNFMWQLRAQLENTRTNGAYMISLDAVACHCSCHGSCHGSRGRR